MGRYYSPKSSGSALVCCIISILCAIAILGVVVCVWVAPRVERWDWVKVQVSQEDSHCGMETCHRTRGGTYPCPKCTVEYKYVYNGQTYSGKNYNDNPSEGKSKVALIDPNAPGEPYSAPSLWALLVMLLGVIVAFYEVFRYGQMYRSFRLQENKGVEDLSQSAEGGEELERMIAEENSALPRRKIKQHRSGRPRHNY